MPHAPLKSGLWFAYIVAFALSCLAGAGWGIALLPLKLWGPWGWLGGAAATSGFATGLLVMNAWHRQDILVGATVLAALVSLRFAVAALAHGLGISFAIWILLSLGLMIAFMAPYRAGILLNKEIERRFWIRRRKRNERRRRRQTIRG